MKDNEKFLSLYAQNLAKSASAYNAYLLAEAEWYIAHKKRKYKNWASFRSNLSKIRRKKKYR